MTDTVNIIANTCSAVTILRYYDVSELDLITCHFTYLQVDTNKTHYSVFVDPPRVKLNGRSVCKTIDKKVIYAYPDKLEPIVRDSHDNLTEYIFIESQSYTSIIQTGTYAIELAFKLGYSKINLIGFTNRNATDAVIEALNLKNKITYFDYDHRGVIYSYQCVYRVKDSHRDLNLIKRGKSGNTTVNSKSNEAIENLSNINDMNERAAVRKELVKDLQKFIP